MKTTNTFLILAALVAAPGAARADAIKDLESELSGGYGSPLTLEVWTASQLELTPASCTALLAKAKKAGAKSTDKLSGSFKTVPGAVENKWNQGEYEITWGDAEFVCEEYGKKYGLQGALIPLQEAAAFLKDKKSAPTAEDAAGYNTGAGTAAADKGRACAKAVDDAIAGGVAKTTKVTLDGAKVTIGDARTKYCQAMVEYGEAFEAFITEAQAAKQKEKAAKYEAAGITGDKLKLFVEYDSVYWRGKGCEIIDDVEKLKKATKLYQWLENADGTHTIRTYTFKGMKVKSKKDKKYKTEKKAYKGCK